MLLCLRCVCVCCSEDRDPWGQEHGEEHTVAASAGREVPGGVHPYAGDPGHQHPLELQE